MGGDDCPPPLFLKGAPIGGQLFEERRSVYPHSLHATTLPLPHRHRPPPPPLFLLIHQQKLHGPSLPLPPTPSQTCSARLVRAKKGGGREGGRGSPTALRTVCRLPKPSTHSFTPTLLPLLLPPNKVRPHAFYEVSPSKGKWKGWRGRRRRTGEAW